MGKLVQFENRGRKRKAPRTEMGEAEIILFTGVRYERDSTTLPGKPPTSVRPKRKRG